MDLGCFHTAAHTVMACWMFVMVAIGGPWSVLEGKATVGARSWMRLMYALTGMWMLGAAFDVWSKAWGRLPMDALPLLGIILGPLGPKTQTTLVWWKQRMRRRGQVPDGVWKEVSDTYWWQRGPRRGGDGARTELEAAEPPLGRGVELESAPQPAGRGTELEAAQRIH